MDKEDTWKERNHKEITTQEKWNMIVDANKEAATEVLVRRKEGEKTTRKLQNSQRNREGYIIR